MPNFPRDQFDELSTPSDRIGAHRAPKRRGRGWIAFAWAALATGLLVVAGVVTLSLVDPDFRVLPEAAETTPGDVPEAEDDGVAPVTDPGAVDPALELSILVLNGTDTSGLQNAAGDQLAATGWNIASRANASVDDETETVVYYRSAEYEGIALGLVQQLAVGSVQLSDAFQGAPVTVVLGADYAPPAG